MQQKKRQKIGTCKIKLILTSHLNLDLQHGSEAKSSGLADGGAKSTATEAQTAAAIGCSTGVRRWRGRHHVILGPAPSVESLP